MSNYRRHYQPGGTYFFTVNLYHRNSTLLVDYIDQLRAVVARVKRQRPFSINAWVVLPDHMHTVWTLPEGDVDFPGRWREIKKAFSQSINKTGKQFEIWQPRYWEHTIFSEEDYRAHVDYVYINPLKHGLVSRVRDWPYSSFHRDVRAGVYPEDWGGDVLIVEGEFGER